MKKKALLGLKKVLLKNFSVAEIILYGSKAGGDSDKESDIDVLVILRNGVDDSTREAIFSISFKIEMKYDVIFGILVEPEDFWNSPSARSMPIHWNIEKEGIAV